MEIVVRHTFFAVGQITVFVHHRFSSDEHIRQAGIVDFLIGTYVSQIRNA